MSSIDALLAVALGPVPEESSECRGCGCTDLDCSGCIQRTGKPCYWTEPDLCSACDQLGPPVLEEATA